MKLSEFAAAYCDHYNVDISFQNLESIVEDYQYFELMFKLGEVNNIDQFFRWEKVEKSDLAFETADNFDGLAYYSKYLGTEPAYIELKSGKYWVYNPEEGEEQCFNELNDAIKILEIAINYEK